jgi:Tfp pilus assembly protein PilZ
MNHSGENKNRRLKPRYSAEVKVEMLTKGLDYHRVDKTANVSTGGLFVCTDYLAPEGERIHCRIIFSDRDSYFDVKTRVAWVCDGGNSHPKGLGLEFIELNEAQQLVINRFLRAYVNVQMD